MAARPTRPARPIPPAAREPGTAVTRRAALAAAVRAAAGAALLFPALPALPRALHAGTGRGAAQPAPLRLLLVLPTAGAAAAPDALRAAVRDGATIGAEEAGRAASLLGTSVALHVAETDAAADAGTVARLAREAGAGALLGGFADGDALALAAAAAALDVPFLNVACASDALRVERCASLAHAFHVTPSLAMRLDAALLWLAGREDGARWRVPLPDGAAGEWLRAHARRRAAGGDAERVAAAALGDAATDAPRVRLLGEAADDAAGTAARGAARVLPWHHTLQRYGAGQVNDRFVARFGRPMPAAAWPAWMAVKVAWEGAAGPRAAQPPRARLAAAGARYDGHKGRPLDFRPWDHQLRQPLYVASAADGDGAERVSSAPPDGGAEPSRAAMDRLGATREESTCTP